MHVFDSNSNWNHTCIAGLSRNLFYILQNILTLVSVSFKGKGYKSGIYAHLIGMEIHIDIIIICDGGGR